VIPCLTPSHLERLADQVVNSEFDVAFASGDRSPARDAAGEEHLAECAVCRTTVDEILANRKFLSEIADPLRASVKRPAPHVMRAEHSLLPGYRRLDVLGHGGQAVVHRAVHEASGRIVAVKVLRFGSVRQRSRLAREAQLAAALRHPCIVTVHDCGDLPEGGFAIVMELVDGVSLDAWSTKVRAATDATILERRRRIARLFVHLCDAVTHAHQNGVIHRDLKPTNVLVDSDDKPRVLDFGVAHAALAGSAPVITRTEEFSETIAYAAPETLSNSRSPSGTLADVYAIGVMLHEAIVGRPPHQVDGSVETIVRAIVDVEPARPAIDIDGAPIDADLSVIMLKSLARDPARRYDSSAALGRDLDNWIARRPIDARRDRVAYVMRVFVRRHRLAVAAVIATFAILSTSVVALAILYRHAEVARADAKLQAASLANQLFERNLERALILASADRPGPAEALAWREALTPSSPRAIDAATTDPDFLALLSTLRQVVARNPCLAATVLGSANAHAIATDDHDGLVVSWDDRSITRLRSSDLTLEWKTRLEGSQGDRDQIIAVDAATGRVAASSDRRHVVMMDPRGEHQLLLRSIEQRSPDDWICMLAFDAGRLWIAFVDGCLFAVDVDSGAIVREMNFQAWSKSALGIDLRAGVFINTAAASSDLVALDLADGTVLGQFNVHPGSPHGGTPAALCTDGRVLYSSKIGLELWNPRTQVRAEMLHLRANARRILAPDVDPNATIAVLMIDGGELLLVDLARPDSVSVLSGHPARQSLQCAGDWVGAETLVTAGFGGLVRVWDARPERWITTYAGHSQSIGRLSFGPDQRTLYSFGRDGSIGTWPRIDASGKVDVRALPDDATSIRAAFSPDGTLVALDDRSERRRVIVRRTKDFAIVAELAVIEVTGPLDFNPDGKRLAAGLGHTAKSGPFLGVLDVESGTLRTLDAWAGHPAYTRAIRHSADGRFVAWALIDGRLFVVDAGASTLPAPFQLRGAGGRLQSEWRSTSC